MVVGIKTIGDILLKAFKSHPFKNKHKTEYKNTPQNIFYK